MVQRIKTVQESDLRMLGSLARSIQRVLPVTQADIDAAAALGQGWVVTRVVEVTDPLDNLRGGTQLVIRQNSILPGQSVQRVLIVSGPGGETVIVRGSEYIALPDAIANSLEYLKAFGGTEQRNLPDGYTQLEYLESSGTQYIDTGITDVADSEFILDMKANSTPSAFVTYLGASNAPTSIFKVAFGLSSNGKLYTQVGTGDGFYTFGPSADTNKHSFRLITGTTSGGTYYIDDTSYPFTYELQNDTTLSLFLFARNNAGTASNFASMNCYGLKIKKSGVLVRNFIPARRNSDNVLGMYDTVSQTFFTNAGTGTFTAGADVTVPTPDTPMDIISNNGVLKARHQSGLPLGYQAVEYIESTGTQYIDTGLVVTENNSIEITGNFTTVSSPDGNVYQLFGVDNNSTSPRSGIQMGINSSGKWFCSFGTTSTPSSTAADTNEHTFRVKREGTTVKFYVDDSAVVSGAHSGSFATTATFLLFRRLYQSLETSPCWCWFKMKRFKMYNNDTLIRDMIPVKRNSDNVLGMYDLVSGQFFTNAGTGAFTAGSAVSDPVEIYTDSVSRNLYNANTATIGKKLNETNGALVDDVTALTSDYIGILPSTSYRLHFTRTAQTIYTRICYYDSNKNFVSGATIDTDTSAGPRDYSITTVANAKYIRFCCKNDSVNVMFEQGSTATPYVPYWNTTETINVHGKNLFDITALTRNAGYMVNTVNGLFITSDQYTRSDYIPVSPNTQYARTISGAASTVFYDSNKDFLSARTGIPFTTPADCHYIIYNVRNNVDYSQGMMVKGGELPTTYEPYYDGGTATSEMLLKVGDYQDVQEILSGAITRNIGIKVLDGTEDWQTFGAPDVYTFTINFADAVGQSDWSTRGAWCTHFDYYVGAGTPSTIASPNNTWWFNSSKDLRAKTNSNFGDVNAFKAFLASQYAAGHPVIIIYPLATPTTESVAGQTMQVQQGDNVVEITQAAIDNLEIEGKYEKSA